MEKANITVCKLLPDKSERLVSSLTIVEDENENDVCKAGYRHWKDMTNKYAGSMEVATCSRDFEGNFLGKIILRSVAKSSI